MRRKDTSILYFEQRIPADLKSRAVGVKLALPVGGDVVYRTITDRSKSVRVSLRTRDPAEVKVRQAEIVAYLERVWAGLRQDGPMALTQRQAVALSGELYRSWADETPGRTLAYEFDMESGEAVRLHDEIPDDPAHWEAVEHYWTMLGHSSVDAAPDPERLEETLGALVDRLLMAKGIGRVDEASRTMLVVAFWRALRDAIAVRRRRAEGDYGPDPKSERFPEWKAPGGQPKTSLMGLFEGWQREAEARGLAPSTFKGYRGGIQRLVDFLGYDDASRVTPDDIIRFKDRRLADGVSARTVKDGDLAALKSVLGWAVVNRRLLANPASGVSVRRSRVTRLRSKDFTPEEATAILEHAVAHERGGEAQKTWAAKRWVSWLCAYTGARVGEVAQLRKQDVRREGDLWVMKITPEAGSVKTKEAREVPLHRHLIEAGFPDFVEAAPDGYLFFTPSEQGWRGPCSNVAKKVAALAREVVSDPNVAPNHGWRHTFKTVGREAGIEELTLDVICGHAPGSAGRGYGAVTLKVMADALARMPCFKASAQLRG